MRHEKGASTSKHANAAACYCLRRIVEYLRTRQPHLVTHQFAQKFTNTAIRHKVYYAKFVETLRDFMDFFDRGIAGIVGEKAKQLFEFSINSITTAMGARDA